MTQPFRIAWTLGLAAALLLCAGAQRATAVAYQATILAPAGYTGADLYGISGTSLVGSGYPSATGGFYDAQLWNNTTNSFVSLNPGPEWNSKGFDASGDSQVGSGTTTTILDDHALLWHGTAASFVDLNPTGFYTSTAYGVSGNNQVGFGGLSTNPGGGLGRPLLWHGSAASAVDLTPSGYAGGAAFGVFGDSIVGFGENASGQNRGLFWSGPAHTSVNLHPAGFAASLARGVSQDSQVGTGYVTSFFSGARHALLWHGSAASAIDLNPPGFTQTDANGVAGTLQVGAGQGSATGGNNHALLWEGSAGSVVDLHALLAGLGPILVSSEAHDVDELGVIVGFAMDSNFTTYAVKWSPVPEPMTATLVVLGFVIVGAMTPRGARGAGRGVKRPGRGSRAR